MKTHFFPREDDDESEQAPCGTWLGDSSELSSNWAHVDCRRCLNHKTKIMAAHAAEDRAIAEQMGNMADYMRAAGDRNE